MIDLKLAEYNSEGKFVGFIGLAEACYAIYGEFQDSFLSFRAGFIFGKNSVQIVNFFDNSKKDDIFLKDEKDPLNRFDGLFDGRTYGNGRFVLIINDGDDVYLRKVNWFEDFSKFMQREFQSEFKPKLIGNLHKNPGLYEKVKNNEL